MYLVICVGNKRHAYANRLDLGQLLSISDAGLRTDLFTTPTIIPQRKQAYLERF